MRSLRVACANRGLIVMSEEDVLGDVRRVCPGASLKTEAGQSFVDLPGLKIPVGNDVVVRDALLTLQGHSGYASRLFLSQPIQSPRTANWTVHTVLGRAWHTPSWNNVAPGRAVEMLLQHLKAYA
jgi:hypothetical protein